MSQIEIQKPRTIEALEKLLSASICRVQSLLLCSTSLASTTISMALKLLGYALDIAPELILYRHTKVYSTHHVGGQ